MWGKCIFISLVNRRDFLFVLRKLLQQFKTLQKNGKNSIFFWYYLCMYDYETEEIEDKDLKSVGLELMFLTPEKCSSDKGITAVELAKRVDLPVEIVKKKLHILKDVGIIRVKGINPKYWKFDNYNFQRMDEDDEIYRLLCNFEDVDFDRFFQY